MTSLFFIFRLTLATMVTYLLATVIVVENFLRHIVRNTEEFFVIVGMVLACAVITNAFSHVRRVRLIAGAVNSQTLSSRQRRQIEIPFEAGEAFDMIDAAIRELPGSEIAESARDSLQVQAPRLIPRRACRATACCPLSRRSRTRSWPPSPPTAKRAA